MVTVQRMKVANEKASKTVTMRGNVPKSSVSVFPHKLNRIGSHLVQFRNQLKPLLHYL